MIVNLKAAHPSTLYRVSLSQRDGGPPQRVGVASDTSRFDGGYGGSGQLC